MEIAGRVRLRDQTLTGQLFTFLIVKHDSSKMSPSVFLSKYILGNGVICVRD